MSNTDKPKGMLDSWRVIWTRSVEGQSRLTADVDVDAGWQAIAASAGVTGEAPRVHPVSTPSRRWRVAGWNIAAIAGCAVVVCGIVFGMHHTPQAVAYTTTSGQRLSVTLDDGTQVTLAPESRLQLSARYRSGIRQVDLTGEAYFAVVHDARHPFAVLTRNLQINDVGTEFDVHAYPEDHETRVAVALGAVALVGAGRGNGAMGYAGRSFDQGTVSRTRPSPPQNTPPIFQEIPLSAGDMGNIMVGRERAGRRPAPTTTNDTTYLTAGDMAEVTDAGLMVTHHADIAVLTGWQQGRLTFTEAPLAQVVRELERAMNLKITLSDSALATMTFTGSFDDMPADRVLTVIAQAIGAHYDRRGREVTISPGVRTSNPTTPPSAAALRTAQRSSPSEP